MNPFKRYTRTILVYSSGGSYNAAAIGGVLSGGWGDWDDETGWSKPEKTSPSNASELTTKQHAYPKKSIAHFANCEGRVEVYDLIRKKSRKAKPSDPIFCARRAWDQRSESGYMREIEDEFQELTDRTISNLEGVTRVSDKRVVGRFFALWYMRSRYNQLKDQEYILDGIEGDQLTLEQEEKLERDHYLYVRSGGRIPCRQLNGVLIQQKIDKFSEDLESIAGWGLISPEIWMNAA
ncbi:hypothetical protein [Agrobacterium sp.]|uniref:hypothetical protein n=1 Tax=Agrobacterium sp. TaxID=361 RepID=UPI0028AC9DAE|nr:hypothetical protein [Agrobacterium sp.]